MSGKGRAGIESQDVQKGKLSEPVSGKKASRARGEKEIKAPNGRERERKKECEVKRCEPVSGKKGTKWAVKGRAGIESQDVQKSKSSEPVSGKKQVE